MYDPKDVVGDFFEDRVAKIFDLVREDQHSTGTRPDLVAKDAIFRVEVKASAYDNGGVVKERQLKRFETLSELRFFAFAYHSLNRNTNMKKDFPTEPQLRQALDLKSLYLFPFSIVKAHYDTSYVREKGMSDCFVQIRESLARLIFDGQLDVWQRFGLESKRYSRTEPHKKIHIITNNRTLETEILRSIHQKCI